MGKRKLRASVKRMLRDLHNQTTFDRFMDYFYDCGFKLPEYTSSPEMGRNKFTLESSNNVPVGHKTGYYCDDCTKELVCTCEREYVGKNKLGLGLEPNKHMSIIPEEVTEGWTTKIWFYNGKIIYGPYACPVMSSPVDRDGIAKKHGIVYYDRCVCTGVDGSCNEFKRKDGYIHNGAIWQKRPYPGKKKK